MTEAARSTTSVLLDRADSPPGEKSVHIWNPKDCEPGRYLCGKRMSTGKRIGFHGPHCPLCWSIRKGQLNGDS